MKKPKSAAAQPKYIQFANDIRQRVKAGDLEPGDRLPSLNETCVQWGMGLSTAQRAHDLLAREDLIVREQGRGAFIAKPRRVLNGCIGFFRTAGDTFARTPYSTHLIEGMQQAASPHGMEVLLLNPRLQAVRWEKVDAVIALSEDFCHLKQNMPELMPGVALLHRVANVPSIVADEYSGIQAAVQHLTAQGHRRIGYLLMREYSPEAPLRLAGYEVALREAGIEPLPEWVWRLRGGNVAASVSFVEIGRLSMRAWLNNGFLQLGCTALLAQNDETALGAIDVLREAGLKAPGDISIVGFDGTEVAEYCSPPLTTVHMPLRAMGTKAVEVALKLIQGERTEQTPQVTTLPTQLKVRETTSTPKPFEH